MKCDRIRGMSLAVFVIFGFVTLSPAHAGVYKWVDDMGKTHYTDSKSKIPRKYRKKERLKTLREVGGGFERSGSSGSSKSGSGKSGGGDSGGSESGGSADSEAKFKDGLFDPDAEKKVKSVIAVLKKDIAIVDQFKATTATRYSGNAYGEAIRGLVSEKESVSSQLEGARHSLLKEAKSALDSSISQDKGYPGKVRLRVVQTYFSKLEGESNTKHALLDKLNAGLEKSKQLKEEQKKLEKEKKEKEKKESSKEDDKDSEKSKK